ncbi:uncharacterized protein LOC129223420 isoform X2 [Uloborus diversus]|uniref:uncharacterized protein LOC129223420 isoform X2 n=1 Tax=Uloborus diversus TaxID=327109 RepID=UPI00240A4136|nr:uncharacterized protein LOC129223420 isoform X2 [Uloborus diversus]
MCSKLTGYDFWNDVLKSPRFVAAPMVDMSELSFRMVCRNYNAQLCYSPMLHSQQYLQDSLYRQDNFSTCADDRPLIVQLCANDPESFVNAGLMLSSQCDGIDLNLGCPQAIAKKGLYGAFLQDNWDLVHSIVRKAAADLPVPVTCKMRILPGAFKNSVYFAKMLENAGCSVLAVHGRTREQKGHATGLASWDAVKEIKEQVKIPVISNGNILSFSDIENCLKYTGADAVMSAEALLHNPALFSGQNPPVWEIIEEYLQNAEKYNTPIRHIRCHLFRILYLCIHQDDKLQKVLAEGSTLSDFYSVCDILKHFPQKHMESSIDNTKSTEHLTNHHSPNSENNGNKMLVSESVLYVKKEMDCNENYSIQCLFENSALSDTENDNHRLLENTVGMETSCQNPAPVSHSMPIWLCHSRPRILDNGTTKGCYSKYFNNSSTKEGVEISDLGLSKKKFRKALYHEKVIAAKKKKRKAQKLRRKQRIAEEKSTKNEDVDYNSEKVKMTKKQCKLLIKERLLKAQGSAPRVCINLDFASEMETKDLGRLSSQLRRLYGSNRQSDSPLHLFFCALNPLDELYKICIEKNDGFASYVVEMTDKAPEELFKVEDLVYLSPDSETVLEGLNMDKIYVIGGIVDGTVKKGVSLNHAKNFNIQTARLPIHEYLVKCSQNPGTTVLTVNQEHAPE